MTPPAGYRATMRSPMLTEPDVVVRDFFDALTSGSTSGAAALLTDDVWWENIGLRVIRGKRSVVGAIALLHRRCRFDVQTHHLAVEAPVDPTDPTAPTIVLTERTDTLTVGPLAVDFWVCGRLEVRDGLICGWRDYFSTTDIARGVVRGAVRMVTRSGH